MPVLAQIQIRYWRTVAPVVRDEMERWQARAQAIEDPELRALARAKLRDEGTHARAAAMLATLAPRPHRADATRGIVALELLFDYLDGLTERPADDPLGEGERLFGAFLEAVTIERCDEAGLGSGADAGRTGPDGRRAEAKLGSRPDAGRTGRDGRAQETLAHIRPHTDRLADSGYLDDLSRTVATALMRLPAARTITATAKQTAARAAQAQTRMHAAAQLGIGQVEEWARSEAGQIAGTIGSEPVSAELYWRELLTGSASSVLALHALIAAAADPGTTPAQARAIADAYLPACMLPTLLDGLIDHEQDGLVTDDRGVMGATDGRSATDGMRAMDTIDAQNTTDGTRAMDTIDAQNTTDGRRAMGEMGGTDGSNGARPRYLDFYPDLDELSQTLTDAARRAADRMGRLPQGLHHLAILAGLIAYYSSLPGADSPRARPLIQALQGQLTPLTIPALALTRMWNRRTTSATLT